MWSEGRIVFNYRIIFTINFYILHLNIEDNTDIHSHDNTELCFEIEITFSSN